MNRTSYLQSSLNLSLDSKYWSEMFKKKRRRWRNCRIQEYDKFDYVSLVWNEQYFVLGQEIRSYSYSTRLSYNLFIIYNNTSNDPSRASLNPQPQQLQGCQDGREPLEDAGLDGR